MITRLLPMGEWDRLGETDIPIALPYHRPEDVQIVVVEDGDRIVGAWAVLRVVQLEGVWIAPEYRKHGAVAKRLLDLTMATARKLAPYFAFTGSQSDDVSHLLTKHLDAKELPMKAFVIPLKETSCP